MGCPRSAKPALSTKADQDESRAHLARTVLTPDNDLSFASGFLETKDGKEVRRKAEADAEERERQIWGVQKDWSENERPLSCDPKKDYPMSYAPGTAENPERLKDSRIIGKVIAKYVEKKAVDRALTAIFGALLARGTPPLLMTKDQADMFGLNNEPI